MMPITETFTRPIVKHCAVCVVTAFASLTIAKAQVVNYSSCVELARVDPDAAFDAAIAWAETDLSGGASHCAGLALVGLGLFEAAADRFTRAAVEGQKIENVERALLHQQAGDAWLMANSGANATAAFTHALTYIPENPELLFGRARGYELDKQTALALQDVDLAIARNPAYGAAYLLRARLYRQSKQLDAAAADIDAALANGIDEVAAGLERGLIRFEMGNEAGALEDWQMIVATDRRADGSPGPAATAASRFIAEVRAGAPTQP
tara:strand:+ start:4757 stop:5554 length:798 start_codon:yes stop_codon:yes gene_type:complete